MGAMTLSVMAATLAILAVALFLLAAQSRRRIGIPAGALVYQDLPGQPFDGKPLRSHTLGISGKPDCLIRTVTGIVPVELKNASKPPARGEVYPSHMIQALAYCALVEDQIKIPAPYALVIYAGQQVRPVEFNEQRRRWPLDTIRQIELARQRQVANRNHDHQARCAGCGVRSHCDQALL
jgi:CRISPR-associated exonuclease Cas4